jgi:hypothetical protein
MGTEKKKEKEKGKKNNQCKPPQVEDRAGITSVDWVPFIIECDK